MSNPTTTGDFSRQQLDTVVEALEKVRQDLIEQGRYYGSDCESFIDAALAKLEPREAKPFTRIGGR